MPNYSAVVDAGVDEEGESIVVLLLITAPDADQAHAAAVTAADDPDRIHDLTDPDTWRIIGLWPGHPTHRTGHWATIAA